MTRFVGLLATLAALLCASLVGQASAASDPISIDPIVGISRSPSGGGYQQVATNGGVFAFGDAVFAGSAGDLALNSPVVGMAATPSGGGYWLTAADGGVFAYGDAVFAGSAGDLALNSPVVGMAATPSGGGYWLTAADGGVFAYGDAVYYGRAIYTPPPDGDTTWVACPSGGEIEVDASVADSVGRMFSDAAAAGHSLCGWGFRSYDEQVELRRQNCGDSYYDIYQKPSSQCSPPTAIPGTSNHETGLAIDVTAGGQSINSQSMPAFEWLADHAAAYGFYNYPPEPWHWSTTGS